MHKKIFSAICLTIIIIAMCYISWHNPFCFDQLNQDLTLDFALVGDTLVYCASDGIYKTDINHPEQRKVWIAYPTLRTSKPSIYISQSGNDPTMIYYIFKSVDAKTFLLKQDLLRKDPLENTTLKQAGGYYHDFGDIQAFLAWPNQLVGPNYIVIWHNGQQIHFNEQPFMFGYNGFQQTPRLFRYQDNLYFAASYKTENGPVPAKIYTLNYKTNQLKLVENQEIDDFTILDNQLYFLAQGTLYQHNLDTAQCIALSQASAIMATEQVNTFMQQSSGINQSQSIIATQNHLFYLNKYHQLCLLQQKKTLYRQQVQFLQQQEDYIVVILQIWQGHYRTVILDKTGKEILTLPMMAKISIENDIIVYTNGHHLYKQKLLVM